MPGRIPQLGRQLPLINEARSLALEQQARIHLESSCNTRRTIIEDHDRCGVVAPRLRLAGRTDTIDQHTTRGSQCRFDAAIKNTRPVHFPSLSSKK